MKVAIYIEQGVTQLVLTPETEWEKSVTAKLLPDGKQAIQVYRGGFYECMGGWYRQRHEQNPDSLILRIDKATEPPEPETISINDPGF